MQGIESINGRVLNPVLSFAMISANGIGPDLTISTSFIFRFSSSWGLDGVSRAIACNHVSALKGMYFNKM